MQSNTSARRRNRSKQLDVVTTASLSALDDMLHERSSDKFPWLLRLRLDANTATALHRLAAREGVPLGAVLRRLIRESLRREGAL